MKSREPLTLDTVDTVRLLDRPQLIPDWKPILVLPPRLVPIAREFWGDSVTIIEQTDLPRSFR